MEYREGFNIGPLYIYGAGKVGTALGFRLSQLGVSLAGAHCRTAASAARASAALGLPASHGSQVPAAVARAATVVIAVPDPLIAEAAEQLVASGWVGEHQVFLHCSGARGASELAALAGVGAATATLHPLLSFADPEQAGNLLSRASFAVEGESRGVAAATALVHRLGGAVMMVPEGDRALYHAAAAVASNHVVAVLAQAAACLTPLGFDRFQAVRALTPLVASTLANLEQVGLPGALTGPVSRGDADCVRRHLEALQGRAPAELEPYVVLARRALEVAREQGFAGAAKLAAVEEVLDNAGPCAPPASG